jgi:hypothetical protein
MFWIAVSAAFAVRLASGALSDFRGPWAVSEESCGDEEGFGEEVIFAAKECLPAPWNRDLSVIYTCGEGANITQQVFANDGCWGKATLLTVEPGVCLSGPYGEQIKWTCLSGGLMRPAAARGALRGAVPELAAASARPAAKFVNRELCGAAIGELQSVWAGQCQPVMSNRSLSVIYTCAEDGSNVTQQVFENAVCSGTPWTQTVEQGVCSDDPSGEQARWSCGCRQTPQHSSFSGYQPC